MARNPTEYRLVPQLIQFPGIFRAKPVELSAHPEPYYYSEKSYPTPMAPLGQDALDMQMQILRDARAALNSRTVTVAEKRHQHAVERVYQIKRDNLYDVPHPPHVKVPEPKVRTWEEIFGTGKPKPTVENRPSPRVPSARRAAKKSKLAEVYSASSASTSVKKEPKNTRQSRKRPSIGISDIDDEETETECDMMDIIEMSKKRKRESDETDDKEIEPKVCNQSNKRMKEAPIIDDEETQSDATFAAQEHMPGKPNELNKLTKVNLDIDDEETESNEDIKAQGHILGKRKREIADTDSEGTELDLPNEPATQVKKEAESEDSSLTELEELPPIDGKQIPDGKELSSGEDFLEPKVISDGKELSSSKEASRPQVIPEADSASEEAETLSSISEEDTSEGYEENDSDYDEQLERADRQIRVKNQAAKLAAKVGPKSAPGTAGPHTAAQLDVPKVLFPKNNLGTNNLYGYSSTVLSGPRVVKKRG